MIDPQAANWAIMGSPIEQIFAHNAPKYLVEHCRIEREFEVTTIVSTFRLDFLLEVGGRKIGVECDGRDFHNSYRDEWRDALIFGAGVVDVIYRFTGADLFHHTEDVLFRMAMADPSFFSERGKIVLAKLASAGIAEIGGFEYPERETLEDRPGCRQFWRVLWREAQKLAPTCKTLDELIAADQIRIAQGKTFG